VSSSSLRYGRVERERRFVLEKLPSEVDAFEYVRLEDLFVRGTHLRLRRVTKPNGDFVTTKLGQKIVAPDAPEDPRQRQMTTIYLPDDEGAILAASLEGSRTIKRRYKLREQGLVFCIDMWESPAHANGMILAEVEADTLEALEHITVPAWASREVTSDPTYSAIRLASEAPPA
jgi:CYTH domain-containing protein